MVLNYSLIFYFLLPILDFWIYRLHINKQKRGISHKTAYYFQNLAELWIPTLAVLLLCVLGIVSAKEIGLVLFNQGVAYFPNWFSLIITGLTLLAILYLIIDIIRLKTNPAYRESLNKKVQSASTPEYLKYLLPGSKNEKKLFQWLSFSAGITEEILYRGFLIFILALLLPGLNIFIILLIASLFFGLGHTYQGVGGILKTSILGFVFGLIYLSTGTIFLGMLLHFLIDLSSSFLQGKKD